MQILTQSTHASTHPYVRFILALFKKKFPKKIKKKPEEILRPAEDYSDIISELQTETWIHTLDAKALLPSQSCLILREKNLSFQLQLWNQATNPEMIIPKPEDFGWEKKDEGYELQADSPSNLKKQKTIYDTIMRRCGCKSVQCLTKVCKCKKAGRECTSLCECVNCENTESSSTQQEDAIPEPIATMEEVETSDSENEELAMPDEEVDVDF